jgi:5-formyltetrahydrofolate cyclo-ligase
MNPDKKSLRQQALALRQSLDTVSLSKTLCHLIEALPVFQAAKTVGLFWPMPHEVDLRALIKRDTLKKEVSPKKQWVFPRMSGGNTLAFHLVEPEQDLDSQFLPHAWGPLEPVATLPEWNFSHHIDQLLIVPALLLDRRGCRLGYGKGFYDRVLEQFRLQKVDCFTLSVAPHACLVDTLPQDPWDVPVQAVLTERCFLQL